MTEVVSTDMTTIRDHRDVHKTIEFNAFIDMSEQKKLERENSNRKGDAGLENNRSLHKKVETKKEQEIERAKEKVKEFKEIQAKLLSPTPAAAELEVEETFEDTNQVYYIILTLSFQDSEFFGKLDSQRSLKTHLTNSEFCLLS